MKNIVVTGATGMIGSHFIDYAASKNVNVYAVTRKNSPRLGNIPVRENITVIECNNDNICMLKQLIKTPCDIFFHFAWEGVFAGARNDVFLQSKNIVETLNAIKTAYDLGCKKFVFAGSQAEYGLQCEALKCDTDTKPITPYGIAKCTAFSLGKALARQFGMEICSGRILSAYGPKDAPSTMVSSILSKMIEGEICRLSPCTQIWDFIYAGDVAKAFYLIGEKGVDGKAYPIGSGIGRPLKEYVEKMYDAVGNKNAVLKYGELPLNESSVEFLEADINELGKDTGFEPKVKFEEGIKKTIEWLRDGKRV